jgi:DNA-binding transcriptional MerR regulator
VLSRLAPEFPDLTPSKLRFLGKQGLIAPSRTDSGYRKFSGLDVERIRLILCMQRDHYLPLKVIHAYLDDLDAGREPELPGGVTMPNVLVPAPRRHARDAAIRSTAATAGLVAEAVAAGLLPATDTFDDRGVEVLRSLVALQRIGVEPRHLRGVRVAALREVALVESALVPVARRREPTSKMRARELAGEALEHVDRVRASLVAGALENLDF